MYFDCLFVPSSFDPPPKKKLLFHVSLDMTHCVLSCFLGDWRAGLEELLGAVARSGEAGSFCLMSDVCRLLFPQGELIPGIAGQGYTCQSTGHMNTQWGFFIHFYRKNPSPIHDTLKPYPALTVTKPTTRLLAFLIFIYKIEANQMRT